MILPIKIISVLLGINLVVVLVMLFIARKKRVKYLAFIKISNNECRVKKSPFHRMNALLSRITFLTVGFIVLLLVITNNRVMINEVVFYSISGILFLVMVATSFKDYKNDLDFVFKMESIKENLTINNVAIPFKKIDCLLVKRSVGSSGANLVTFTLTLKTEARDIEICSGIRTEFVEVVEGLYSIFNLKIVDESPDDPRFKNLSKEPVEKELNI